jgi:hypothetical protein
MVGCNIKIVQEMQCSVLDICCTVLYRTGASYSCLSEHEPSGSKRAHVQDIVKK